MAHVYEQTAYTGLSDLDLFLLSVRSGSDVFAQAFTSLMEFIIPRSIELSTTLVASNSQDRSPLVDVWDLRGLAKELVSDFLLFGFSVINYEKNAVRGRGVAGVAVGIAYSTA